MPQGRVLRPQWATVPDPVAQIFSTYMGLCMGKDWDCKGTDKDYKDMGTPLHRIGKEMQLHQVLIL